MIEYARGSRPEQNLDLQLDTLIKSVCDRNNIFVNKISGANSDRSGFNDCLGQLMVGDVLLG